MNPNDVNKNEFNELNKFIQTVEMYINTVNYLKSNGIKNINYYDKFFLPITRTIK